MNTKKTLVKLIDALTIEAGNCSELASVQREAADKQRVTACRLEELSGAIQDIAIELRADLIVKAGGGNPQRIRPAKLLNSVAVS